VLDRWPRVTAGSSLEPSRVCPSVGLAQVRGQQFSATWKRRSRGRGRDAGHPAPPAQIPACTANALGSLPRVLTSNRSPGQGCKIRGVGSHRAESLCILCQSKQWRWLRLLNERSQWRSTWVAPAYAGLAFGLLARLCPLGSFTPWTPSLSFGCSATSSSQPTVILAQSEGMTATSGVAMVVPSCR
jgi:hypothetical protein